MNCSPTVSVRIKQKRVSSEIASQEEQYGANVSSVAPSSEELWVQRKIDQNALL